MEKLQTERLLLRDWTPKDADDFFEYAKSSNLAGQLGWKPHGSPKDSLKVITNFFLKMKDTWAIVLKEEDKVIGSISLHGPRHNEILHDCELRCCIAERYQNRGYGKEACDKVVRYAFDIFQINNLLSDYYGTNASAKALLEGLNFRYLKHYEHFAESWEGVRLNAEVYILSRADYQRFYR